MNASAFLGLIIGVILGGAFAWLQLLTMRRNEMLERQEKVPSLLRQIPGSATRCAFLLMGLILAQVFFPGANLIWMSIGLTVAYAIPIVLRLRLKYSHR